MAGVEVIGPDTKCPHDIPEHLFPGLKGHALKGRRVGSFLSALLENRLRETVCGAAPDSLAAILALVRYVYNELPGESHGSPAKVRDWRARGGQHGIRGQGKPTLADSSDAVGDSEMSK